MLSLNIHETKAFLVQNVPDLSTKLHQSKLQLRNCTSSCQLTCVHSGCLVSRVNQGLHLAPIGEFCRHLVSPKIHHRHVATSNHQIPAISHHKKIDQKCCPNPNMDLKPSVLFRIMLKARNTRNTNKKTGSSNSHGKGNRLRGSCLSGFFHLHGHGFIIGPVIILGITDAVMATKKKTTSIWNSGESHNCSEWVGFLQPAFDFREWVSNSPLQNTTVMHL